MPIEQFMTLQKYFWVFYTPYQTQSTNRMNKKVQYIYISINTARTVESQMGTTLEKH